LGNLKGRDHLEDLSVDGKIILEWIREIGWEGVDWMHLAQDKDQWRALVKTVMNVGFIKGGELLDYLSDY
jgi:hypothetical protein